MLRPDTVRVLGLGVALMFAALGWGGYVLVTQARRLSQEEGR